MHTSRTQAEPWSHFVRLDGDSRFPETFELTPPAEVRKALADRLGIPGLKKLRFSGRLEPEGKRDWRLDADLGATVVQACVVTLAPVSTRIDERVERRYLAQTPDLPEGDEIEMPDDVVEPLPASLDLGKVMVEALALALPLWPRADDAELEQRTFAEQGVRPMSDEDSRPFADLKRLARGADDDS